MLGLFVNESRIEDMCDITVFPQVRMLRMQR